MVLYLSLVDGHKGSIWNLDWFPNWCSLEGALSQLDNDLVQSVSLESGLRWPVLVEYALLRSFLVKFWSKLFVHELFLSWVLDKISCHWKNTETGNDWIIDVYGFCLNGPFLNFDIYFGLLYICVKAKLKCFGFIYTIKTTTKPLVLFESYLAMFGIIRSNGQFWPIDQVRNPLIDPNSF